MSLLRTSLSCALVLCIMSISACTSSQETSPVQRLHIEEFGTLPDGTTATLFTLRNTNGLEARITNYGAILTALLVPDKNGQVEDVVLGFDTLEGYLTNKPYFGSIVGRFANRIGNAQFELDGQTYTLAANNGPNHLHGGIRGFDTFLWEATPQNHNDQASVRLTHTSPDGDEGYPGTVQLSVTYTLTDNNALILDYEAKTDKATPLNVTNHAYFNLAGQNAGSIVDHVLTVAADKITPVSETLIPTGDFLDVTNTPFDFQTPTPIGDRIDTQHAQILFGRGYDHNFVLSDSAGVLKHAARVLEPMTGRILDVHTTEPGMQLYTGNFLSGSVVGKGGRAYPTRSAFCLETQHFPDSPNQPNFPSTILRPGDTFQSQTIFTFSVADS